MIDANLESLRKWELDQERDEMVEEEFLERIQPYIDDIDALISSIKLEGDNFTGYDFTELVEEQLKALI